MAGSHLFAIIAGFSGFVKYTGKPISAILSYCACARSSIYLSIFTGILIRGHCHFGQKSGQRKRGMPCYDRGLRAPDHNGAFPFCGQIGGQSPEAPVNTDKREIFRRRGYSAKTNLGIYLVF